MRDRFADDRAMLAASFPGLRHFVRGSSGGALVQGTVDVDIGAGVFEAVALDFDFAPSYPSVPPRVFDAGRRWVPADDRHLMWNHEFCLWLEHVDRPDVSTTDGLRTFLQRLLPFLRDQFVFDDLGRWPNRDWAHHAAPAYAQHLVERLGVHDIAAFDALLRYVLGARHPAARRCPCGSGLHYGHCHRSSVESLSWVRGLDVRRDLRAAVMERLASVA
jgi:hypothetical protein